MSGLREEGKSLSKTASPQTPPEVGGALIQVVLSVPE
jgi:hypothetical protein